MDINEIGGVIVTLNPKMIELESLIDRLLMQIEHIEVVDNGSDNINELEIAVQNKKHIHLSKLRRNYGIAYALNRGIIELKNNGFNWAVTFDQDSLPSEEYCERFCLLNKPVNSGLIGAYYVDRNWSKGEKNKYVNEFLEIDETFYVITSGAFVNIEAWSKVLGFDEKMFIDWVDWDFNKRLLLTGFKVYRTKQLLIDHEVGEVIHRNYFLRRLLLMNNRPIRDHSSFRQYYIFRNRIIFLKRYGNKKSNVYVLLKSIIALREILLLPDLISKLKASAHGIFDGLKYSVQKDEYFKRSLNHELQIKSGD